MGKYEFAKGLIKFMSRINFLEGNRIFLRALLESDVKGPYLSWLNDKEVCLGNSHHVFPYHEHQALEYIRGQNNSQNSLVLAIVLKDEDKHIGNIALQRINWVYRTAELAILLGDKSEWHKGFGLESSKLIIEHGFSTLNLNKIYCSTFCSNHGMSKLAKSLGMQQEGIRRQAAYKNGQFLDILDFGILAKEFQASKKQEQSFATKQEVL